MGVVLEEGAAPGVPIGKHLLSGQNLYAKYEDMHVDIWGPRSGKSSSRVIPAILEAPGAVLTTSNKRDVVDATRDPREAKGGKVWIFDPQKVADGENTWWWDPLSWVTDEVRAADLAAHFAAGDDGLDAKKDTETGCVQVVALFAENVDRFDVRLLGHPRVHLGDRLLRGRGRQKQGGEQVLALRVEECNTRTQ